MPGFPADIEIVILAAAEKHRVPKNLALRLAWTESRGVPTAVSPAGARGLFQLMPETGKAYGLRTEADFFDPAKSAEAGLAYLRKQYDRFGKWWLALAAYNRGPGWLRRNQNFNTWPPRLIAYIEDVFGRRPGEAPPVPKVPTEIVNVRGRPLRTCP